MNPIAFKSGEKVVDKFTGETVTILTHGDWWTDIQYPTHVMRLNSHNNPRYILASYLQLSLFQSGG